jgi:hypothetical protein
LYIHFSDNTVDGHSEAIAVDIQEGTIGGYDHGRYLIGAKVENETHISLWETLADLLNDDSRLTLADLFEVAFKAGARAERDGLLSPAAGEAVAKLRVIIRPGGELC